MATGSLNHRLENAIKTLLDALAIAGLTVNTGTDDESLQTPYAVCSVEAGGDEVFFGSGIFPQRCSVVVATSLDEGTFDDHKALVSQIEGALVIDELAENMNSIADEFYVYQVEHGAAGATEANRRMMTQLNFTITAVGIEVTA